MIWQGGLSLCVVMMLLIKAYYSLRATKDLCEHWQEGGKHFSESALQLGFCLNMSVSYHTDWNIFFTQPASKVKRVKKKQYFPVLGWSLVWIGAICLSVLIFTESCWRRTDTHLMQYWLTSSWVLRKHQNCPPSDRPENTATAEAACTPANTVWPLIYHQSLKVNASS